MASDIETVTRVLAEHHIGVTGRCSCGFVAVGESLYHRFEYEAMHASLSAHVAAEVVAALAAPTVEIRRYLHQPSTCRITSPDGVVLFDGIDRTVLLREEAP